ncbi:hypothetical protein TruAng_006296 [Truncatella angustata]|nr:hypothetical protein TruAng_006296 [Truncatella angustata]
MLPTPNQLSVNLINNLKDVGGSYPNIRVGGTTANYAVFVSDQEEPIILHYATPGADQPYSVTWGPTWLDYFDLLPEGIEYTLGLSFNSSTLGQTETIQEAAEAYSVLNRSLYAFEVGNEFDAYPVDRETQTWKLQTYVDQWLERTDAVAAEVIADQDVEAIFQAGVFVAPNTVSNDSSWNPKAAFEDGIATTGKVKSFSIHQYFGAACRPVKPTLADSLLNHTYLTSYMSYHEEMSTFITSHGVRYVIGETNSIACQGLAGVSDVFGAALWSIDYALYAASLNVSSMYFHMGLGYRYAAWQPVVNGTNQAGPRPLYYGNLIAASTLAGGDKQVRVLANETSFTAYGIYKKTETTVLLDKIVLLNLVLYNSTVGGERTSLSVQLPESVLNGKSSAIVRRFTAPGAESTQEDIEWAGRKVSDDGVIVGQEVVELLKGDTIRIPASEAVVISFRKICR